MTIRDIYEATLIELNKVKVNSILLEQFNYFYNKAVQQFCNKTYNLAEFNQQNSDNLRLLKDSVDFTPTKIENGKGIYNGIFEQILNINYFHILNCVVEYENKIYFDCPDDKKLSYYPARRLTANIWGSINNNYYMKPKFNNPYFYLHDTDLKSASNILLESNDVIKDLSSLTTTFESEEDEIRNPNTIRIEIRCGKIPNNLELKRVYIDYLKHPDKLYLTQAQLDLVEDTSSTVYFQNYVCYEIINELVKLILENIADPRLQSNIPINQTIASAQSQNN